MDESILQTQAEQLRADLKIWEKQFQADNGGRKAGREDIKANTEIAAKYKDYNRARDLLAGKPLQSKAQKRPRPGHSVPDADSPSKRAKCAHATPRKSKQSQLPSPLPSDELEHATPATKRSFIGPTPQKDGMVLGIFDLLPVQTPSRPRTALGDLEANTLVTPSRMQRQLEAGTPQFEERARGSRTPASSGKRFLLDSFVTPRKCKGGLGAEAATPSSSMGRHLATPAFLRRDNLALAGSEDVPLTPRVPQPWKKRAFGRSLSGMIREIRRQREEEEDKRIEEEMDVLREIEAGDFSSERHSGGGEQLKEQPAKVLVEDSQPVELDQDGFVPSDIEREEEPQHQDAATTTRKPWKKRGLKRQTRRVNMRPVEKKVLPLAEAGEGVADTQLREEDPPSDAEDKSCSEFGGELEDVGDGPVEAVPMKSRRTGNGTLEKAKEKAKETREVPKKAVAPRKVKADAHANYRALKIKNKNSKAKGRGRFGRGR